MIYVLMPCIAIVIGILFFLLKNVSSTEKRICLVVLVCNIFLILFYRLSWPGVIKYASTTVLIWINILINVICLIMLLNSKIILNKKMATILLIAYFMFMFLTPIYKFEDHEHIFYETTGVERIEEYVNYYNCYGIKMKKVYQSN